MYNLKLIIKQPSIFHPCQERTTSMPEASHLSILNNNSISLLEVTSNLTFPLLFLLVVPLMRARMLSCFSRVQLCDPMDCSLPGSLVHGIIQ